MRISDWSSDVCSSDLRRTISHAENHGNREDGEHPYHRHRGQRWSRAVMTSNADQREADREQKAEEDADADGGRVDLARQQNFEADIDDPHAIAECKRTAEHTPELQSLMSRSNPVFCIEYKKQ